MIVTGLSRSGTSLVLALLYCTVDRNKVEVVIKGEKSDGWNNPRIITKNPAAIYEIPNIYRPLIMIRDPRAVLTSKMDRRGYFVSGDYCFNGKDPGVLPTFEAIKRYEPRDVFRYEHLVQRPDGFQEQVGQHWGIDFRFEFSMWPVFDQATMKEINRQWGPKLHGIRSFDKGHNWRDHMPRIRQQFDQHPRLFEVVRAWGYEEDDDWYQEVLDSTEAQEPEPRKQRRFVAQPKGVTIGFKQK